jgi:hypothetical protein
MKHFFLFSIAFLFSCHKQGDLDIKVVDSDDVYEYSATFDPARSLAVERFINARIAPTHITSNGDLDVTTILNDKTTFDYESSPGELIITLDKKRNNQAGYNRIKKMCQELNQIINPKQKKQ